jgi:cytoskeletal protein RodZ
MQYRPVEPAPHARHGLGLLVPAALTVIVLIGLLFLWERAQGHKAKEPQEARALTRAAAQTTSTPQSASPSVTAATPAPVPPLEPRPPSQPEFLATAVTGAADTLPAAAPTASAGSTVARDQESEATNSAAITPPPKPAPLRLQAIVFDPKRPSALISGKTLIIGEKLGDSRVVAIDQQSVTLVGAGKTNILSLPE